MAENRELVAVDQDVDAPLLSGKDLKDWEIVQRVLAQLSDKCTNTQAACKEAGVVRSTYYAALHNPIVQQLRLQAMVGTQAAAQKMIEKSWLPVIANMASIARDGDSREAVQAARFLRDVYDDIQRGLDSGAGKHLDGESAAAKAIRSFLGGKKVLLRQTTTTQEIEVEEDAPGG